MKLRIELSKGQLGSTRWVLVVTFRDGTIKRFLLGQDIKFIRRVLGYDDESFYETFGMIDKRNERKLNWNDKISQRIANYIKNEMGLTPKNLRELNEWELSAE